MRKWILKNSLMIIWYRLLLYCSAIRVFWFSWISFHVLRHIPICDVTKASNIVIIFSILSKILHLWWSKTISRYLRYYFILNRLNLALNPWIWADLISSFGGSMVRALDYNGTLERREFKPRLRIFSFFSFNHYCL